ncbi:MAG: hypothetical protein [Bacteriophage sp.]|nr:MAG: hypothetical protein [Bacteriophage sp.]UWI15488.1 MAG: hypothetical protein [Bacteriophage sp.]
MEGLWIRRRKEWYVLCADIVCRYLILRTQNVMGYMFHAKAGTAIASLK